MIEFWAHRHDRARRVTCAIALAALAIALGACGDDDGDSAEGSTVPDDGTGSGDAEQNACPPDGCTIEIGDIVRAGDELEVHWTANFLPDTSQNHIHVYWDTYTAEQVSDDAASNGVEQGEWHLTDEYPTYTTQGVVSVSERGDSTTLCVTSADRDHIVLDSGVFDCADVSDLLEP